ncbi:DUF6470 family protein [Paenibacillus montanisoli]|uniref:Uncharacterized protein n=1 Tax=Paenibacillus montanisoli TaxID=2081970 RepID=A0A328TZA7_9BACL|nr:DUF6470 family protein [Paenibacillus montanisoli]RAP73935.1 hypothetical protein DL346_22925 [Paenibacillus montanisoli]
MELPRLSIHQTYAKIGIQTQAASLDIQSPPGELSIQQPQAKMEIESSRGELEIDSSEAWAALGMGSNLEWLNSIYSQCKSIALQAIAKIVEDGNRMAQITNPNNAFAELARDAFQRKNPIQYVGEASVDHVRLHYRAHAPIINIEPQLPLIEYTAHKPEIQYHPGSVEVYLKQKNSVEIRVSEYDKYI